MKLLLTLLLLIATICFSYGVYSISTGNYFYGTFIVLINSISIYLSTNIILKNK